MRKLPVLVIAALLTACGGGGGSGGPASGGATCSANGQKQFVLDSMRTWYLWNDRLPASVNLNDFATPETLLDFLTTFSPDDGSEIGRAHV